LKDKTNRYSRCEVTDQKCFENSYYASLGNFANSCRTSLSIEKNRIAKQNLESLANQTEQIINKSKQCSVSRDLASGVTSIGINSITAIAALTPGAGPAGTLVGLSGRIPSQPLQEILGAQAAVRWRVAEQVAYSKLGFRVGRVHAERLVDFILGNGATLELPGNTSFIRRDGGLSVVDSIEREVP
jgi:hypothetical protein